MRRAAAAAMMVGAWLAAGAPSTAQARSPADVHGAEQRFDSAASGLRRDLSRFKALPPEAQERLRDVQFVYRRSARPEARHEHRFGAVQVTVSDGWMVMAEQLLGASLLSNADCGQDYLRAVAEVERANRRLTAEGRRKGLRAWPLLREHLERSDNQACRGDAMRELRLPQHTDAVAVGLDAALAWTILRQLATLPCTLPPPAATPPLPAPASAASALASVACKSPDPHGVALAWARALDRDLRPAAPVVLAELALACLTACEVALKACRQHLWEAVPRTEAGDPAWADLETWSDILTPRALPDSGQR